MGIGVKELIFLALIILILFGAKRLPEIGRALGKAIKEFKRAGKEIEEEIKEKPEDKEGEESS